MFHRPRRHYSLGKVIDQLHVLPTSTRLDLNHLNENIYMKDWISDPDDIATIYVFEKKVNTKNPAYSAIVSAGGPLSLDIGQEYDLIHDQTGARICRAKLENVINVNERKGGVWLYKTMSMMVFK